MRMSRIERWGAAVLFPLLMLLAAGCGRGSGTAEGDREQVFNVRGWIRGIPADRETLAIEHEAIPGFMPAMTMPFYLKDPSLADGLAVGDPVAFRFVVGDESSRIDQIAKLDPAEARDIEVADSQPGASPLRARIPRLEEGDLVPSFQLVNQEGEAFETGDFYGDATLLNFIFTRCPVPDFCPLMSSNFKTIQEQVAEDPALRGRVQLLSVTIDPEYDTPEVLKEYAKAYTDSTENWTFATGDPGRIDEITSRFSLFVDPNSTTGTIDHALATALIGADGRLITVWRGNRWTTEEVLEALRETVDDRS